MFSDPFVFYPQHKFWILSIVRTIIILISFTFLTFWDTIWAYLWQNIELCCTLEFFSGHFVFRPPRKFCIVSIVRTIIILINFTLLTFWDTIWLYLWQNIELCRTLEIFSGHFVFLTPTGVPQAGLRGTLIFLKPYGLKIRFLKKNCCAIFFPFQCRYKCNAPGLQTIIKWGTILFSKFFFLSWL